MRLPMNGFIKTSELLKRKVEFFKKVARKVNIEPTKISTNKYFMSIPVFTDQKFSIDTNSLKSLVNYDNSFVIDENKLIIRKNVNNTVICQEINISGIEENYFNLDEPLMSFEPKIDFLKFILKLEQKHEITLQLFEDGKVIVHVNDIIEYNFVQNNCKIGIADLSHVEIRVKRSELQFLKELLDTTLIFCIFDDFLIVYSYDKESTIAVKINILN